MATSILISTYPSSTKPSQDNEIKTHKCGGQIFSRCNNILSCSGLQIGSWHQNGFKLEVFGDKWSNFELGEVKEGNLFNGLKRRNKIRGFKLGVFREKGSIELGEDKDGVLFNGLKKRNKFKGFKLGVFREKGSNSEMGEDKDGVLFSGLKKKKKNNKRVVLVRLNKGGFGNNGGGGDNSRVLGNLALAVGLTYLSLTGQLGWLLDAIVSVWLLAVILPIVGLGVLFWWAGRDIIQSSCPNCGNEFQIFRSVINEDSQQCPYCSQPFSVVDNEFVRDPGNFSSEANTFGEAFNDFFPRSKKKKDFSKAIVDVEAEVKDVD